MNKFFVVVVLFFWINSFYAQTDSNILAEFGDRSITSQEFKYRYEFTPQIKRQYFDENVAREELLFTIIAENLFSIEAENQGYDTLTLFQDNFIPMEKMYVRDALYTTYVSDKVEFNNKKFIEGMNLANRKIYVDYIFSTSKSDIENAFLKLQNSTNFDSTVSSLTNVEYVGQPYEVVYGKMYFEAERAIYSLTDNAFTKTIQSPNGWYIFRKIKEEPVIYETEQKKQSLVKSVVNNRIEDSIYNDFWREFFAEFKVNVDRPLFLIFADKMHEIVIKHSRKNKIAPGDKITLTIDDLSTLYNSMDKELLNQVFVKFDQNPMLFKEFLRDFIFEGFFTFATDKEKVTAELNSRVRRQVELEQLTRYGYSLGMNSKKEVKEKTDIWKENYLSTLLVKNIIKETDLTDQDIKEYLEEKREIKLEEEQVNIIELLSDSLEVIQQALEIVDNDTAFKQFNMKHTKRVSVKKDGGEFGYFPISDFEEIGKLASSMNVGDVYGPLETSEGYSLFKVIGKIKNKIDDTEFGLDENIKATIKYQKLKDKLESLVLELAEKYNLKINDKLLASLKLLNAQMIVYKYMGFGGRMQAFPYSSPFYEWGVKWKEREKDIL